MKIAITGAGGHIGVNLCRYLISSGHEIKALIHEKSAGLDHLKINMVTGNLLDTDSLINLVDGADIVFHLAASISIHKTDPLTYKTNLIGTENVLNVCREKGVKRFIHFSSIHAIKHHPFDKELNESRELDTDSRFDYVRSKALAEKMVLEANGSELETVVLSPTAVIGPEDHGPSLLGDAIIRFYKNKTPALIPGGYDWADVRDICTAAVNAIEMGRAGEKFILAGHWRSLYELAETIHQQGGAKPPWMTVPVALAKASAPFLNYYFKIRNQSPLYTSLTLDAVANSHRNISCEKAREKLKYHPRPFEESVKDTIEWFKKKHFI
jgi:dihydroflavonol-4-reductase